MKRKYSLFVALMMASLGVQAQSKIKDGSITPSASIPLPDAILELESISRGLLLPRIALDSTELAAPMSGHTAGMIIYNTATIADVSPGMYYNNGGRWIRTPSFYEEPWRIQQSSNPAKANTQHIYQMGSVAIGKDSVASGASLDVNGAIRGGNLSVSPVGLHSLAVGDSLTASGLNSAAFGWHHIASGENAMAWGGQPTHTSTDSNRYNIASGTAATAWGYGNRSTSWGTTTWGTQNTASNPQATAFGARNQATGFWSTSFGEQNKASNNFTTAFGKGNTASARAGTAFGENNHAKGTRSLAFGLQNIAASQEETVFGRYNADTSGANNWTDTDALMQAGNGTNADSGRSNALTLLKNGKLSVGTHTEKPSLSMEINGTDGIKIPSGTSAQRPAAPVLGTLRYNNELGRPEMYVNDLNKDGAQGDAGWLTL
ncbi:MAG: hypothetical protein JNL13_06380 [Chitinophagaceae bacterium]|nr:hypothetical protein [Chitinophagaceae bacterium]